MAFVGCAVEDAAFFAADRAAARGAGVEAAAPCQAGVACVDFALALALVLLAPVPEALPAPARVLFTSVSAPSPALAPFALFFFFAAEERRK